MRSAWSLAASGTLTSVAMFFLSACSLTSDVSISPLLLQPGEMQRGAGGVVELTERGEFNRAIIAAKNTSERRELNARELAALGRAEMSSGRLDDARKHLRAALALQPYRTEAADVAWDLSQAEYLANQFAASRQWANVAQENGINIRSWHLDYLNAMSGVDVYRIAKSDHARVSLDSVNPSVPRVGIKVNGDPAVAVIDTGAVLSIISEEVAQKNQVISLGDFEGTFYGLLGEPIPVHFGLLKSISIGSMEVLNVPVAIMPDKQLNFFINNKKPFKMDVLLGANLLKEFRITLDFRSSRAEFEYIEPRERAPIANQNLFFVGFRPFIHAMINRTGWYLFILDTGSEITFLNETQIGNTSIRNSQKYHAATLQGLGGATKHGAKIEDVAIGVDQWSGFFRDLPLYSTETTKALGIVGENFLKNFRLVLDFGSMRASLEREEMVMRMAEPEAGPPARLH